MRKELVFFTSIVLFMVSCEEGNYYPSGLRPYQVEYLLTNGAQKYWEMRDFRVDGEVQPFESCGDSIWWSFEVIDADSISAYQLAYDAECVFYDTTSFGSFSASGEDDFSDSLLYEQTNGRINSMNVRDITSTLLSVDYVRSGIRYEAYLVDTQLELLARQVEAILHGKPETSKLWRLRSQRVNGLLANLSECADTTFFQFTKVDSNLRLDFIQPLEDCLDADTIFFGNLIIPEGERGRYQEEVIISGGSVPYFDFVTFGQPSFQVVYVYQEDTIRSVYSQD
ncbi:MAG: hypothetical protein RIC35_21750 [Marinoscillum sp.]